MQGKPPKKARVREGREGSSRCKQVVEVLGVQIMQQPGGQVKFIFTLRAPEGWGRLKQVAARAGREAKNTARCEFWKHHIPQQRTLLVRLQGEKEPRSQVGSSSECTQGTALWCRGLLLHLQH